MELCKLENKELENRLDRSDIKPTAMRLLVLQLLMESTKAYSLKELESSFYNADRSTLFRTLKTFEEHKIIHSIDDGSGMIKYALCFEGCNCNPQDQHYHFHCNTCSSTFCLPSLSIPMIDLPTNFTMEESNMVVKGKCANCNIS